MLDDKKVCFSGVQPSGNLTIGNYLGAIKNFSEFSEKYKCFYCVVDQHAITVRQVPADLRRRTYETLALYMACGLDPEKNTLYVQSHVPAHTEMAWMLDCFTMFGELSRMTQFKDKSAKHADNINAGLFTYPVLMAADILLYKSNAVPVGKDQKQHLEITRDIAIKFNQMYREVFVIPEPIISESVAVIPGTDGQKMSKSYNNTIELFGNEKAIRKKIMSIPTDSTPMEDPKDPDKCNIFALFKLFSNEQQVADLAAKYRAGNFGYGHAKQALFEAYMDYFAPMRRRREELEKEPGYIDEVLRKGAEKANAVAAQTMDEVYRAVGLR